MKYMYHCDVDVMEPFIYDDGQILEVENIRNSVAFEGEIEFECNGETVVCSQDDFDAQFHPF